MGSIIRAWLLVAFFMVASTLSAANVGSGRREDLSYRLEMLRLELSNHEAEIRTLNEKITTQQEIIEALRHELTVAVNSTKNKQQVDARVASQEGAVKSVVGDIDKLRTHANASSSQIQDHSQRLKQLEACNKKQTDNLSGMQAALNSILEALGAEGEGVHEVRSGESLGVIAQKYHVKIKEIKALNKLKNDTIVVGQKLRIPERKHE